MNKTYKKSDIDKYVGKLKEEEITELIDASGTLIDRNDNFRASTNLVRSKKTSDDFARSATQGPEAYFIYGGPYYGVNYSYTVSENEKVGEKPIEEAISPELIQDLKAFHDIDIDEENEMKNMVDEIIRKKKR